MLRMSVARPGGPGRLTPVEVPPPTCKPGEVLVAVEAAGVNYADCVARMGLYRSAREMVGWPLTPGFEVTGTVIGKGAGVGTVANGDPVIALTRFGGYAQQVAVPETHVFSKPANLTVVEAAAVPVSFLTALHAVSLAAPLPGSDVLVHSAAGGAGLALTQVAASRGCHVVGVVGDAAKSQAALAAGAARVLVRTRQWRDQARTLKPAGYAAVFDAGGNTLRGSASLVAPMGRLVAYGSHGIVSRSGALLAVPLTALRYLTMPRFGALELANANRSVMAFNLSYLFNEHALIRAMMAELIGGFAEGRFKPPPIEIFALTAAPDAHRRLQSGRTTGKLVLVTRAWQATP